MAEQYAALMEPIARFLLGQPNARMSSKTELRYGSHGSLAIDLEKGTWFDHEAGQGGGTLDLITRETKLDGSERTQWLIEHGFETGRKVNGAGRRGKIIASYDYCDEVGTLLFQVVRFEPKDFRQRKPDRSKPDGWSWSVKDVRQVPYRLPDLIEHIDGIVFIVEGEKDCDRLWTMNVPATTNAGGVGKWRPELCEFFHGADIVIIPDYDPQKKHPKTGALVFHDDGRPILPGQDHAQDVAAALVDVAARVRVLELWQHWPNMPLKGDVSNWIDAGHSADDLYALVEQTSQWSGRSNISPPSSLPIYCEAEFIAGFVPPNYLVDGVLQRRFVYALTGQTGHAKTALALLFAKLVASGGYLGPHSIEAGRVVYFVGENPDDIRMRVIGYNSQSNEPILKDRIWYIPGVFNIGEMFTILHAELARRGTFSLIIVDTSAAYFLAQDENANPLIGAHARMLRRLTELPGGPTVLVLCHPIKHAQDVTQLLPRGGGAFLAEMDGNLTCWKHDDILVELHHGKLRGPGFEPMTFRLERLTCDQLVDAKGRRLPTVKASLISRAEEDRQTIKSRTDEDLVMAEMLKDPGLSMAAIAEACGWMFATGEPSKSRVQKAIDRLREEKPALVKKNRQQWVLTDEGKKVAREAALRLRAKADADTNQSTLNF